MSFEARNKFMIIVDMLKKIFASSDKLLPAWLLFSFELLIFLLILFY